MRLRRLTRRAIGTAVLVCGLATHQQAIAAKPHPLRVQSGIFTVDGMPAVTALNFEIVDFHYFYIYVPGSGTTVVSDRAFPGAREQKNAFRGTAMTITAGARRLQLTAGSRLRGTHAAWVRFEPGSRGGMRLPAISYGDAALVPAIWPGEQTNSRRPRFRLKVRARRPLRSGKLCLPSAHGQELCATVREVLYQPD